MTKTSQPDASLLAVRLGPVTNPSTVSSVLRFCSRYRVIRMPPTVSHVGPPFALTSLRYASRKSVEGPSSRILCDLLINLTKSSLICHCRRHVIHVEARYVHITALASRIIERKLKRAVHTHTVTPQRLGQTTHAIWFSPTPHTHSLSLET